MWTPDVAGTAPPRCLRRCRCCLRRCSLDSGSRVPHFIPVPGEQCWVYVFIFDENELLRSHWYLYWGNIAYKQEAYSLSGEKFFMSETENSCSRLCHPFFSRQRIPKSCNQRSLHLINKAGNKPKCLSSSTIACQTSSIATRCPV